MAKNQSRFREIQAQTIKDAKNLYKAKRDIVAIGISGSARDQFDTAAEDSNSEFLLKQCLDELKKLGAKTELIPLRKYDIRYCKACYSTTNCQCHFPCSCYPKDTKAADDMSNILYDKVLAADIMIFATPVNNFKISSKMALFIDRCISLDGSLSPADPKNTKERKLNIEHTKFVQENANAKILGSGFLRRFSGKVGGMIVTGHEEGASLAISQLFMTLSHFGMAFPPFSNMYAMSSILKSTDKDKPIVADKTYTEEAKQLAHNVFNLTKSIYNQKQTWQYDYSSN